MNLKFRLKRLLSKNLYRINAIKESRRLGVSIGDNCRLVGIVDWGSEPYLVSIGDHVSITSSKFVTHDGGLWVFRQENPDDDLFSTIQIGSNVFIGMDCIIMPGTVIEDNVVIGAGSIVKGYFKSNYVYAGVPAKKIKTLSDYKESITSQVVLTKSMKPKDKKNYLEKKFKLK
ncbi:MAG: acyltransferase [Candidatus Marinimicrobia bacterium]|nr:acyltransferase [Candidatus Neomarinimicrobiota bacterium]